MSLSMGHEASPIRSQKQGKGVEKKEGEEAARNLSAKLSSAVAPRLWPQQQATPRQQGLMAPQPSSLRTSFRALSITRIEIKESVIYTAKGD
jgi:hypothetical protein